MWWPDVTVFIAAGCSRATSHIAAGSMVKSATIASTNAAAVTSPNWRSGGKLDIENARKPQA